MVGLTVARCTVCVTVWRVPLAPGCRVLTPGLVRDVLRRRDDVAAGVDHLDQVLVAPRHGELRGKAPSATVCGDVAVTGVARWSRGRSVSARLRAAGPASHRRRPGRPRRRRPRPIATRNRTRRESAHGSAALRDRVGSPSPRIVSIELPAERLVELLAQMADVHLDDVRITLEREVPHVVEDLGLRHDLAGAAHQELEHRELACGERDLDVAAPAAVRHGIDGAGRRRCT